jgi:hypothetical protein
MYWVASTAGCRRLDVRRSCRALLPALLVWAAAGCAGLLQPANPAPLAGSADAAEYDIYLGGGTRELRGQAFLTTRTGDVKLAAGRLVTLDPVTRYARRWFTRYGADPFRFDAPAPDSLFTTARRTATTDAEGRFGFSDIPAGQYLLRSVVTWQADSAGSAVEGGVVAALVSLDREDIYDLSLSRRYAPDSAALLVVPILPASTPPAPGQTFLRHLSATTCNTGSVEEAYDMRAARDKLVVEAARRGADAVWGTVCRKRGLSIASGCMSRIVCEGDAVLYQ